MSFLHVTVFFVLMIAVNSDQTMYKHDFLSKTPTETK